MISAVSYKNIVTELIIIVFKTSARPSIQNNLQVPWNDLENWDLSQALLNLFCWA